MQPLGRKNYATARGAFLLGEGEDHVKFSSWESSYGSNREVSLRSSEGGSGSQNNLQKKTEL